MSASVKCPRCGYVDTFIKGYLPDTCVCRMCQSQLDWREIPGMGPECRPLDPDEGAEGEGGEREGAGRENDEATDA